MSKNATFRTALLLSTVLLFLFAFFLIYHIFRNDVADHTSFLLFSRGTQLSTQAAGKLEEALKSDQGNLADRIELLAFYSSKSYKEGLTPEDLTNRREHILWVIDHQPSSTFASSPEASFMDDRDPEGISLGKKLWSQQVQANPANSRILYNAGRFFSWSDDWQQSEQFLERAYATDPKNHDIAAFLAAIYWRDARKSESAERLTTFALKSLKVYEQALKDASSARERLHDLPEVAQAAFEAGEYSRAAEYSEEALDLAAQPEYSSDKADALHYSNIVLGRIDLRQGDSRDASAHLLKAAAITGNPHLDTFGPNMILAKELLDKGNQQSVLAYFDLCSKFWKDDDGKLAAWRAAVLSGKSPDFGANLRY
jgi:tetratricopeptide (TPR) repeat protein